LAHPDAARLAPLVAQSQPDLLAVDLALLRGFADRAVRAAGRADEPVWEFVGAVIDVGNAQTALLVAGEPRDVAAADLFVAGGRWLPVAVFAAAVAAGSAERALTALEPALARSPLAPSPKTASDAIDLDRRLLVAALARLTRMSRLEPLGSAPLLRVLLLIEAQTRDLRAAAWGAALGTPTTLRKQLLVTPP
jgi:vacuolar-type H+-ATPase subunit C/Vma6